jgi:hypothetical protein
MDDESNRISTTEQLHAASSSSNEENRALPNSTTALFEWQPSTNFQLWEKGYDDICFRCGKMGRRYLCSKQPKFFPTSLQMRCRAPANINMAAALPVNVIEEKEKAGAEDTVTSEAVELMAGQKLDAIKRMQSEDEELTPIVLYLTDGTLPENGKQAESLLHKTLNKFVLIDGVCCIIYGNSPTH